MGDARRGKEVFRDRIEYPLPAATGAQDFIFYFVPKGDGYRDAGNRFFSKFYKNHAAFDVRSLEDLIGRLAAEVDRGVKHIREVAILAHGNALALLFPALNGVTDSNLREYKYLTAFALACLQKDLQAGKFPALDAKRKKVLAHLQADSWVTVRACNFGRSREGMYALYAFFGGKPNLYAPTVYQFFGTPPIYEGMRLDTRLRVHEHLVKQHFFPKDIHTSERKDVVVTALTDPARFSEPFDIASMRVNDPPPEQIAAYEPLIDQLNARQIGPALRSAFDARGFTLSAKARVSVRSANTQWTITDTHRHEDSTFAVTYDVYESVGFDDRNRQVAVLRAGASIDDKPSGRETVPIQLFFSEEENQRFRGKRLELAAYTDGPDMRAADKARFEAVKSVLLQGALGGGNVDIRADLKEQELIELSARATVVKLSSTGPAGAERITWAIRDQQLFKVQLEHPLSRDGEHSGHTITVYDDFANKRDLIWAQYERASSIGADPDTPGTELAAYLDRQAFDDLLGLLEHLRSPYKPTNAFYIQQVLEALFRRKEYRTWLVENVPIVTDSPLGMDPYRSLSLSEDRDYGELSYEFAFNSFWAEVKASNPPPKPVQADLFAEEDLAKKFKIPDAAMVSRTALPDLDPDSPATDIEELRALEKVGFEPFFSAEKDFVQRSPEPATPDCREFEAILKKWQEVQHLDPDGIREALETEKTSDGKTYWDVLSGLKTHVKAWLKILGVSVPALDWVVMSKKDFVKLVIKRAPFLTRMLALQAIVEAEFVFTIPLTMWLEFAEAQVETRSIWYTRGRLTVIRQWLREVEDLTFFKEDNFPAEIDIDVTRPSWLFPNDPYWIGRYMQEVVNQGQVPSNFIIAPDRLKDGFDDQAQQMGRLGEELLRNADAILDDLLRDSGLEACKVELLRKTGIFDITRHRSLIVRELVRELLAKLPKV